MRGFKIYDSDFSLGLNVNELFIYCQHREKPKATVLELALDLNMSEKTVRKYLKSLKQKGLIE